MQTTVRIGSQAWINEWVAHYRQRAEHEPDLMWSMYYLFRALEWEDRTPWA